MSLDPQVPTALEPVRTEAPTKYHWYQKISAFLLIVFCLEIGFFLLVFPWIGDAWDNNYFSSLLRHGYWGNAYFRGAVSGLGVINLYISFAEIRRLRRYW